MTALGHDIRTLDANEIDGVTGGNQISILAKMPNSNWPKLHAPPSIPQGDTIDNNDNLPDAGGGVVA